MGHYDIASKHLVEHWPEAVLEVIMPGARFVEQQPTELPQVERHTDRVMRVEAEGRACPCRYSGSTRLKSDAKNPLFGEKDERLSSVRTRLW